MAKEYTGEVIPAREYSGEVIPDNPRDSKRAKSILDTSFLEMQTAGPEAATSLLTGAVATPLAGLAGLASTIPHALGMTKTNPGDVVRNVQSALTYQPRSELAKAVTQGATLPMELLAKAGGGLGEKTLEKTGSPLLATGVDTAVQMIPALLGRGARGAAERNFASETERLAVEKAKNTERDNNLRQAKEAGFVVPPDMASPGGLNAVIESAPGKIKVAQKASLKNQETTNNLVRQDLGLPEGAAITPDRLSEIRAAEYEKYKRLSEEKLQATEMSSRSKSSPILDAEGKPIKTVEQVPIVSTPNYLKNVAKALSKYERLSKEYPGTFTSGEIEGLKSDFLKPMTQPMDVVIDAIKELRSDATKNLANREQPAKARAGFIQKEIADAMEGAIEENLARSGKVQLLKDFREARQMIAKTYDVEKALNWATGDVSAQKLASFYDKRPMSGGIATAATFAKQFPKAAQDVSRIGSQPYFSPWDTAFAVGSAVAGHPGAAVAELGARGVLPNAALSQFYQKRFVNPPSYQPGLGASALMGLTSPAAMPFQMPQNPFMVPEDQQ